MDGKFSAKENFILFVLNQFELGKLLIIILQATSGQKQTKIFIYWTVSLLDPSCLYLKILLGIKTYASYC